MGNKIPKEFRLEQNYPNPFNSSTRFRIQIANVSDIKVVVYDVLGRQITTLVSQQLKSGTYEVEFDGANHPSGVYLYRLTAGEYIETKRMILTK